MFSKPVAALLLVGALAAAAILGGYVATRGPGTPDPDADLNLVPVEAANPSGTDAVTPSARGAGGPGRSARPARPNPAGAGSESVATAQTVPAVPGAPPPASPPANQTASPAPPPNTVAHRDEVLPTFQEVEVLAGQILDLQLQAPLSSETARVEDRVEARITKEVRAGTVVAIPVGAKILGSVTLVEKGGRVSQPARLGVRFHTLVVMGAPEVPVVIDPIMQDGPKQSGDSKLKIGGGAAAGAALGWLSGGLGGAIKGGAVGAGAGTAEKIVEGRKPAEIPAGAQARVEVRAPVTITVTR